MKVSPLIAALDKQAWVKVRFISTGQHSADSMFQNVAHSLKLREPVQIFKNVNGSQLQQLAMIVNQYEELLNNAISDVCVVVGDVTSSLACAITAAKMNIPVYHVEAGLRSFDKTMPEEINRLLIDVLSTVMYTPSIEATQNLLECGFSKESIVFVGNIMIDAYEGQKEEILKRNICKEYKLHAGKYIVCTFHRPSNVDNLESLNLIMNQISQLSKILPIVLPIHPRTKSNLEYLSTPNFPGELNIKIIEPLNYIDFMSIVIDSALVITDSGGIQEETTYLGINCLTVRPNTERPITITQGTNQLIEISEIQTAAIKVLNSKSLDRKKLENWDGQTAARIVCDMKKRLSTWD
jgi:UDP-N-acetylglucosamine 2-epimerase (non-hydrolysing)